VGVRGGPEREFYKFRNGIAGRARKRVLQVRQFYKYRRGRPEREFSGFSLHKFRGIAVPARKRVLGIFILQSPQWHYGAGQKESFRNFHFTSSAVALRGRPEREF
jgi:hypothetical protein